MKPEAYIRGGWWSVCITERHHSFCPARRVGGGRDEDNKELRKVSAYMDWRAPLVGIEVANVSWTLLMASQP